MMGRFFLTALLATATPSIADDSLPAPVEANGCHDLAYGFHFCTDDRGWQWALTSRMRSTGFLRNGAVNLIFAIRDPRRGHTAGNYGPMTAGGLAGSNDAIVLRHETTELHGHVVQTGLVDFGDIGRPEGVPHSEPASRSVVSTVSDDRWSFSVETTSDDLTVDQIWSLHMASLDGIRLAE
jgi:hypothetical protein